MLYCVEMFPEARKYYSKRELRNSKTYRMGGNRRRKVQNPAGFELLGIGIGVGLCIGFLLGFTLKGLGTGMIIFGGSPAPAETAFDTPGIPVANSEDRERRRMEKIADTQATIREWESKTFDIKVPPKVNDKEKASRIIDGLYQDLKDQERQQSPVPKDDPGLPELE